MKPITSPSQRSVRIGNVIHIAVPMSHADYHRPELSWVKRRARRLQRFFHCERRIAIAEALDDYRLFTAMHHAQILRLIKGTAS